MVESIESDPIDFSDFKWFSMVESIESDPIDFK